MFQHQGIWLPDGEKHFPEWMTKSGEIVDGRGTYQIKKWRACLPWIKRFDTAIDVGGHVGFWSIEMVKRFLYVFAYEPMPQLRQCFVNNVLPGEWDKPGDRRCSVPGHTLDLIPHALGSSCGVVSMNYNPADSGGTHVDAGDGLEVKVSRLDDEFLLNDASSDNRADFIKIDCEGYELEVLKGAERMLRLWQPCVIVEQKLHKLGPNFGIKGTPAVDFLREMGAHLRVVLSGDYILSWD